jgi:hypothetical protein
VSERLEEIRLKRQALQARCAAERQEFAMHGDILEARLYKVDRVYMIARRVASKPILIGVALAVAVFLGPARLLRWASRGMFLVSTVRRLTRR